MRRWGFRLLAAIGLPLLALLLIEGGLRLGGYGENRAYMVRETINGRDVWRDNPDFFGLFFPPQLRPAQLPFAVDVEKPPNTIRILLLGGSAAMGIPDAAFGMGPMLEELLQARHPEVQIDVLNLANTAINSHVVREIAAEAMKLQPDAVVVYLGNNEVVGPFGAGTVFTPLAPPRPVIAASIALQRTRVGQLLRSVFSRGRRDGQPSRWRGMEMFLDQQVAADDPELERVHENFRANLRAICAEATRREVPVVLSTVGVNLRQCAPFASKCSGETVRALEEEASARAEGDLIEARRAAQSAVEADPGCADAHYRLGRLELALGDTLAGREQLRLARDFDTLRFRADSSIEAIVAEVAAEDARVRFVDSADSLDAASSYGVSGREFFLEHVHLDLRGNHRVATALLPAVETSLMDSAPAAFAGEVDSVVVGPLKMAQYLAYTPWTRERLLRQIVAMEQRPPFTGQSDHGEQLGRLQSEWAAIGDRLARLEAPSLWRFYEQSMERHPEQWIRKYQAALFAQTALKDLPRATELWRALTHELPHFPAAYNQLAECVAARGRGAEARQLLERSLDLQPYQPEMLWNLAGLLNGAGEYEEAGRRVNELLALDPQHEGARKLREQLDQR